MRQLCPAGKHFTRTLHVLPDRPSEGGRDGRRAGLYLAGASAAGHGGLGPGTALKAPVGGALLDWRRRRAHRMAGEAYVKSFALSSVGLDLLSALSSGHPQLALRWQSCSSRLRSLPWPLCSQFSHDVHTKSTAFEAAADSRKYLRCSIMQDVVRSSACRGRAEQDALRSGNFVYTLHVEGLLGRWSASY